MKNKEEIKKEVEDKIIPLMDDLSTHQDGPYPMEEYGQNVWYKDDIQKIAQAVFETTYKLMKNENKNK
jgi:hypothetical protein